MGLEAKLLDLSVVIPVHNEYRMLRYTLPSILKIRAKQYIWIIDRCTDASDELIKRYMDRYHRGEYKLIYIDEKDDTWNYWLSKLYHLGIMEATQPYILLGQADVILDHQAIKRYYRYNGLVSYRALNPYQPYQNVLKIITTSLKKGFSGTLSFPRWEYLKHPLTPNDELPFDEQIKKNFNDRYLYVKTKGVNLRAYSDDLRLGSYKARLNQNPVKVFLWSFIHLKPKVFVGYLHSKRHGTRI